MSRSVGGKSFESQKKTRVGGGGEKIKFQKKNRDQGKTKLGTGQGENKVAKKN